MRAAQPKIIRANINFAALKQAQRPTAMAIRIDPFTGPFAEDDRQAGTLAALAREVVATARSHNMNPRELQIDFDCSENKLDGYAKWLRRLRAELAPLPVIPTVLPSWLKHRQFGALARASGEYILQVHSTALPKNIADTKTLADPAKVVRWVDDAARLGVPFRVSLATYSYLVAFDAGEKPIELMAESPPVQWPPTTRVVRWESDPAKMAELIARWTRARPAQLRAVCWYRLPVAQDNLNWSWTTLAVVMQGRAPRSATRVVKTEGQPNEIATVNEGERDEALPDSIEARCSAGKVIAADALEGYDLARDDAHSRLRFHLNEHGKVLRLPPGARHAVGWVRCEPPTEIQLAVSTRPDRDGADGIRDRH